MAQANAVSNALQETFQIDPAITGIVLAVLVGFVILGGIKRIGKIAEKLIPLMSLVYIGCALAVIACHYSKIPAAFWTMFPVSYTHLDVYKRQVSDITGY